MMQLRRRSTNALLLGLMAIAAAAVGSAEGRPGTASENPLAAQPLNLFSDTRDRPLFSPTRRPPPPPPPPVVERVAPPPPVPPPNVVLLGVVTDENGARAVVRSGSPDKIIRARLGEEIEGWQVTQIEPRRVVLSHDTRSVSFALFGRLKDTVVRNAAPAAAEVELRDLTAEPADTSGVSLLVSQSSGHFCVHDPKAILGDSGRRVHAMATAGELRPQFRLEPLQPAVHSAAPVPSGGVVRGNPPAGGAADRESPRPAGAKPLPAAANSRGNR
jgi:hypothetical protein